jgi:hypothetical protein
MSDVALQLFCILNPSTCGALLLGFLAIVGIYLLFQYIAQKINDKFPQYSVSTIMLIEAIVLTVVSIGIFVILPNVINNVGSESNQSRARSRR